MSPVVQAEIEKRVMQMNEEQRDEYSRLILLVAKGFTQEARCAIVANLPNGELQIVPVAQGQLEAMHLVTATNEFCAQYSTMHEATRH